MTAPLKPAAPFRCRLVIMAKAPVAGRVKTRLARQIGIVEATFLYRRMATAVLARLSGARACWQTIVALAPDQARWPAGWPRSVRIQPQGPGDLGRRMERAIKRQPPGPVVVIGSDIPEIRPWHIREAFRALGSHDAVLGPAADGGYWLVGMKRVSRALKAFGGVRWSTPHALTDTLRNLEGSRVARIATLSDVDTPADAARVSAWCGRRVLPRPKSLNAVF